MRSRRGHDEQRLLIVAFDVIDSVTNASRSNQSTIKRLFDLLQKKRKEENFTFAFISIQLKVTKTIFSFYKFILYYLLRSGSKNGSKRV